MAHVFFSQKFGSSPDLFFLSIYRVPCLCNWNHDFFQIFLHFFRKFKSRETVKFSCLPFGVIVLILSLSISLR